MQKNDKKYMIDDKIQVVLQITLVAVHHVANPLSIIVVVTSSHGWLRLRGSVGPLTSLFFLKKKYKSWSPFFRLMLNLF